MTDFRPGNRLTLLRNGEQFFPALEAAIDAAAETVRLETYIFQADTAGHKIVQALRRAAQRGVRVHLLLDGFGSAGFPVALQDDLRAAGIEIFFFRPEVGRLLLRRYRLRRLHRKIAVIDQKVAFVGGINITDDFSDHTYPAPRLDYAVAVEGPLIADILVSVRRLWTLVSFLNLRGSRALMPSIPAPPAVGMVQAAFVVRDNLRYRRAIEQAYLTAIQRARHEIIIANPYFLPGLHFRHALIDAAARGVRVVLLLQGRAEFVLVYYASNALYGKFLQAGIEIFEYQKSLLHAKVAVIDQEWVTVGSSNIDPFSLLVAREANVVAQDHAFANKLRASLLREITTGAVAIKAAGAWYRTLPRRFLSWVCYGLLRALVGLTGYSIDRTETEGDASN